MTITCTVTVIELRCADDYAAGGWMVPVAIDGRSTVGTFIAVHV